MVTQGLKTRKHYDKCEDLYNKGKESEPFENTQEMFTRVYMVGDTMGWTVGVRLKGKEET